MAPVRHTPKFLLFGIAIAAGLRCGGADSSITPSTSSRSQAPAASTAITPPSAPTTPRTATRHVEVIRFAQVYVDLRQRVAHRKVCASRTSSMLRLPWAVARSQGYVLDPTCEGMHDPPEYRDEIYVRPEWIAYEASLAEYNQRIAAQSPNSTDQLVQPGNDSGLDISASSGQTNPGGDVHVRGYTRKDGTAVHSYTRSSPRH